MISSYSYLRHRDALEPSIFHYLSYGSIDMEGQERDPFLEADLDW